MRGAASLVRVADLGRPARKFELTLTPVTDSQEQAQGVLVFGRDITEEARRGAQLARERLRLEDTVRELRAEQ